MVSRFINSREEYDEAKSRVREAVTRKAQGQDAGDVEVCVNCADAGENIYLTVTGTSIEMGDDGATGRGNRGNGLITPMRPMTMEAIAGKNPVSHVGKIYNVLAQKAAAEIAELEGVEEAYVTLVSKIGSPISQPLLRGVQISGDIRVTRGDGVEGRCHPGLLAGEHGRPGGAVCQRQADFILKLKFQSGSFGYLFFCHLQPLLGVVACGFFQEISKAFVGIHGNDVVRAYYRLCGHSELLAVDRHTDAFKSSIAEKKLAVLLLYLRRKLLFQSLLNSL